MTRLSRLLPALVALPLAACGDDAVRQEGDSRAAQGEILPGSTSDAMIPLDQLRSQGESLAPEGGENSGSAASPAEASEPATEPAANETPEPEPTPETEAQ